MKLDLSFAARDKRFARALRRVRPRLEGLCHEFAQVELRDPIHEAMLVTFTDDMPAGAFTVVPNSGEYFQVLAGCGPLRSDDELAADVFIGIRRAVRECPFSTPDAAVFAALLDRHQPPQA
jgi:hypothetical protein